MQVNSINNYNINNKYYKLNQNSSVSFEGLKIKTLIPARSERTEQIINDACLKYANIIGAGTSELRELTKNADTIKMQFLKSLVTNYNSRNFSRAGNLKEDPQGLIEVYKTVEKPEIAHFNIVKNANAPHKLLSELFKAATDKQSLEFVEKMQHEVVDKNKEGIIIITDLLKSKNKEEFIKNTSDYIAYLKLNKDDKNAVKRLDKMLENGTYSKEIFNSKQAVGLLMKNEAVRKTLGKNAKYLEQNYSKEGAEFIKHIFSDFFAHKKGLTAEDFSDILKMYKTSNSENIQTRIDILKKFKYSTIGKPTKASSEEIKSMKKLFDKIDNDPSSAKFVYKVLGDDIKAKSIKDLTGVLDIVPSYKAEIFHKNIARIIRYTDENERIAALKNEIENPFFMPKRSSKIKDIKKESGFSKVARFIENKIDKMRYNRVESAISSQTATIPTPAVKPVYTKMSPVATIETKTPVIELKRTFKENAAARKLRISNDVNNVIKEKLGAKTFEKQQEDFKKGALVMRLKLLPEIFNSIKESRAMQRITGIRPNIENSDAIKLYSRINGKNRKLVNYMLKQTNEEGKRIYNINEIISKLNHIENKIANLKAAKGKEFNPRDAKKVCEQEFEIISSQHGRLKYRKK